MRIVDCGLRIGRTEKTSDVPQIRNRLKHNCHETLRSGVQAGFELCVRKERPRDGLRREIGLHFVMLGGLRYNHFDLLEMI